MTTPSEPDPSSQAGTSRPRRLHPASPFLDVSALGRQLLAPGAVALGAGGLRLLVLGVAVVLAVRVLAWRRRTYVLDGASLRVEGGLVVRSQQVVPCERIQQVNLVQKLRHRVLGVAVLEVQTAGRGAGSELALEVLALEEAERLRVALLAAKARVADPTAQVRPGPHAGDGQPEGSPGDTPAPVWVPSAWPVVELGYRQLALAGVTGVELLVVLAVGPAAAQLAAELSWRPWEDIELPAVEVLGPALLGGLVLAFVAVWLASAAGVSVFANGGYRLDLVGDELHLSRGLLDHKEATLPLARVQAVRVSASPPRRILGMVSLRIQSAGAGGDVEHTRLAVPILPAAELDRVLALVLPGAGPLPALRRPPPAARRRALVRHLAPVVPVVLTLAVVVRPWGLLALLALPVAGGLGLAAYRGRGHALAGGFLVARSGSCTRRTVVVPVIRSQSASLWASPWQRRLGLASVGVDLAGSGSRPTVVDEAAPVAAGVLAGVVAGVGGARDEGATG
ncbi:MAG: PH domain-containing protein [Actinomycetota bacterium]|nr:PH domain-containing protein [Actinomycetota bacterium]